MIESLLKKLAQHLDRAEIKYMVIGGQAVLLYGRPRLTRDIDVTIGIGADRFRLMMKICNQLGLKLLPEHPEQFVKETNVLPAEAKSPGIRVDFIFSWTAYERQAFERTRPVRVSGYPVKFASLEDVVIHKLVAGRAIDDEDVESILARNAGKIDSRYLRKWLREFEQLPAYKGILISRFQRLRNRMKPK